MPQGVPIFDEQRRLVGVTLMLADVTRLRRLDEVKTGLISTVSHELKTPLTSVRLAIHVLLSEKIGPLSAKQSEVLEAAREDSDRLNRVIEDLLDISRIESGRAGIRLQPMNAEDLVLQVTDKVRAAFVDHGINLNIEVPGDVPPVLADPQPDSPGVRQPAQQCPEIHAHRRRSQGYGQAGRRPGALCRGGYRHRHRAAVSHPRL